MIYENISLQLPGENMNEEILEVAKKFKKWKKTIKYKGIPIPDELINEFKKLYNKYQNENMYKQIGVSKYSWDKRVLEKDLRSYSAKNKKSFILLPEQPASNDPLVPLMKLKLKNGTEITVFQ
jgi:hypothetical protein